MRPAIINAAIPTKGSALLTPPPFHFLHRRKRLGTVSATTSSTSLFRSGQRRIDLKQTTGIRLRVEAAFRRKLDEGEVRRR
jgi:hypothetical protein